MCFRRIGIRHHRIHHLRSGSQALLCHTKRRLALVHLRMHRPHAPLIVCRLPLTPRHRLLRGGEGALPRSRPLLTLLHRRRRRVRRRHRRRRSGRARRRLFPLCFNRGDLLAHRTLCCGRHLPRRSEGHVLIIHRSAYPPVRFCLRLRHRSLTIQTYRTGRV